MTGETPGGGAAKAAMPDGKAVSEGERRAFSLTPTEESLSDGTVCVDLRLVDDTPMASAGLALRYRDDTDFLACLLTCKSLANGERQSHVSFWRPTPDGTLHYHMAGQAREYAQLAKTWRP